MSYKPNDAYIGEFCTARFDTGATTDADSTPTATATHNGADDSSFTLTVTNVDTGRYKVTGTIPSGYVKGDVVQIVVSATVNSVAGKGVIDSFVLDSKRVGDLQDASVSAIQSGLATGAEITSLQSHGDSAWATATGFALASVRSSGLASTIATNLNATITSRQASGNVTVGAYASGQDPATLLASSLASLQSHGDSAWVTATGFALAGTAPGWYAAPDNSDIASLIASVGSSLGSHASSILTIVGTTGVTVATNNDKTGYTLSAAGLDAIATAEPSGSVDGWNFRQRLLALFGRFFNKATAPDNGNGSLTTFQRDGLTTMSSQTISDDGSTQTQGGA